MWRDFLAPHAGFSEPRAYRISYAKCIYAYILLRVTFLERICKALDQANVRYALVGGYAVALHGAPRGTMDIDLTLRWSLNNLTRAEKALNGAGLVSRLPISAMDIHNFREEYIKNRNLLAWNFQNPDNPIEQVDIVISYNLAGKKVQTMQLQQGPVHVLSIDDLINMKQESGRAQDLEDVAALEKLR